MLTELEQRVFVVLLRDRARAQMTASVINNAAAGERGDRALVPPVRGLGFLADSASQEEVNRWWAASIPRDARPVYLLEHDDGLERWLPGLDGTCYVEVGSRDTAALYAGLDRVRPVVCENELQLPYSVLSDLDSRCNGAAKASRTAATQDPFGLLAALLTDDKRGSPPVTAAGLPAPATAGESKPAPHTSFKTWFRRSLGAERNRRGEHRNPGAALSALLGQNTILVAIGSRKGGVGKTSNAAGVAIAAGEALDAIGRRAAIVDANLANPDAWGHMNLPDGAATVRQLVAALNAGEEPPRPVHATTPALACYPEERETSEYSRTDIQRLSAYLRSRFSFSIVDLSNRLPDPTAGAEAAVAAYWLDEADVLVLPTGSSKQEFNGVLDYLDIDGLPPTVVAYIEPRSRRNRQHPLTRRYLDVISRRVDAVVAIPDEGEQVRYALMEGVPVQAVSPALRAAYRRLTAEIARVYARPQR